MRSDSYYNDYMEPESPKKDAECPKLFYMIPVFDSIISKKEVEKRMSNQISVVVPAPVIKQARRFRLNTSKISREAIISAVKEELRKERIVRDATAKQQSTDMTNPSSVSGEGHV